MSYSGNDILNRLSEALEITKDKRVKPVTDRFNFKVSQDKYRKAVEKLAKEDCVDYAREVVKELKGNRKEVIAKVSGGSKDQSLYEKARKLDEMISNLEGLIKDYETAKQLNGYHYDLDKNRRNTGDGAYTRLYWSSFTPLPGDSPYTDAGNTDGSAGN